MLTTTEKSLRIRMALLYVGFVSFLGLVGARLVQLQVFPRPELKSLAARQLQRTGKNAPYRLPLLDRNGEELAISVPAQSVFARPRLVRNKKQAARALASALGGPWERWHKKLKTDRPFLWLSRHVSAEASRKLSTKRLSGIYVEAENKRVYPNGTLAAHVLGFTDIDGNGLAGVEYRLNEELLQSPESGALVRDGRGKPSYLGRSVIAGANKKGIYLTIDRRLQNLLEEELEKSMEETGAQSVMGVVLHPVTGEILALAQRPTFDPNNANRYPQESLTNRQVSHLFEPGSTFKALLAAQALDLGLAKPQTLIDCGKGRIRVADRWISEAHGDGFGPIKLSDVIAKSSNVGAVKIAQLLGPARVASALDKFGLTSRTRVELSGETSAGAKARDFWSPVHLANVGFGQGVSATPLQMVAAFLPFANGGYWIRPRLVADAPGEPDAGMKRVISPQAADQMREILTSVTQPGGTGTRAAWKGMHVAGKTGTAQKYEKEQGYRGGKYYSSFIGFLPAERPELLIGVMVDEPTTSYYGSEVAAPVFRRVAERALPLLEQQPAELATEFGEFASAQPVPAPAKLLPSDEKGFWTMPDLQGLSLRDAMGVLGSHMEKVQVSGTGYLSAQEPAAGQRVATNTPINLVFRPTF